MPHGQFGVLGILRVNCNTGKTLRSLQLQSILQTTEIFFNGSVKWINEKITLLAFSPPHRFLLKRLAPLVSGVYAYVIRSNSVTGIFSFVSYT